MSNSILTAGGVRRIEDYTGRPKIYLAGPIEQHPDGGRAWRENVSEAFPQFRYVDPWDINRWGKPANELSEEQIEQLIDDEKTAIRHADGVLVQWPADVPKCGTPMEVLYATQHHKPVVVWYIGDQAHPAWLTAHTSLITPDLQACIDHLGERLL